jgi:hypothetical protein
MSHISTANSPSLGERSHAGSGASRVALWGTDGEQSERRGHLRVFGSQTGNQRPEEPGGVQRCQATKALGHGHAERHLAASSRAAESPSKR